MCRHFDLMNQVTLDAAKLARVEEYEGRIAALTKTLAIWCVPPPPPSFDAFVARSNERFAATRISASLPTNDARWSSWRGGGRRLNCCAKRVKQRSSGSRRL